MLNRELLLLAPLGELYWSIIGVAAGFHHHKATGLFVFERFFRFRTDPAVSRCAGLWNSVVNVELGRQRVRRQKCSA